MDHKFLADCPHSYFRYPGLSLQAGLDSGAKLWYGHLWNELCRPVFMPHERLPGQKAEPSGELSPSLLGATGSQPDRSSAHLGSWARSSNGSMAALLDHFSQGLSLRPSSQEKEHRGLGHQHSLLCSSVCKAGSESRAQPCWDGTWSSTTFALTHKLSCPPSDPWSACQQVY